ncbi:hypothetical protein OJJOAM_004609 [Cupriavidus sp. H18C1]
MIKVFIADDHAVVRDGVRHILERAGGFEVVAEAEDGTQVCSQLRQHRSDVIVLDLSMPGRSGLELIKQIRTEFPGLRILVLTMHAEEEYVRRAFRAGASGYLTKESAATELVAATGKVASGGTYVSQAIGEKLATGLQGGGGAIAPSLSVGSRDGGVPKAGSGRNGLGDRRRPLCQCEDDQHVQDASDGEARLAKRGGVGSVCNSTWLVWRRCHAVKPVRQRAPVTRRLPIRRRLAWDSSLKPVGAE